MKTNPEPFDPTIPQLDDLVSFYKHIRARPPLDKDFDIREINPEVVYSFDFITEPFRHSFYCITLYMEGGGVLNTGFWKTNLDKPALYFKTPYQLLSWVKPEVMLREVFIVFTEAFVLKHKNLADIIFDLPFFRLEKAIPFEIEPEDVVLLNDFYGRIFTEYRSENVDKFEVISSYVHILLIQIRRLYAKYVATDHRLAQSVATNDQTLVNRFVTLVKEHLSAPNAGKQARSVSFYAGLLATHPNHLNAVVKRETRQTANTLIQEQVLNEAKSLLNQTTLSIKEIAFSLGFSEPAHFNNYFKKYTNSPPLAYRKQGQVVVVAEQPA